MSGLMLALPAALASTPITHHAPFKGATSGPFNYWYGAGCASNTFGKFPSWSAKTGVGGMSSLAKAKACIPGVGSSSSYMSADASVYVYIPLTLSTGKHSVQPTVNFTWNATETYTIGAKCPAVKLVNRNGSIDCYASATFSLNAYAFLYDTTNYTTTSSPVGFSSLYNSSSQYNYTYCYYTSGCSYYNNTYGKPTTVTGKSSVTWYFNLTAVKTHHYEVELFVSTYIDASMASYPRSTATASFNLGTLGNGFKMTQIAVS
ncbi:MAG TPA: hypothetical protein VFF67_09400 [Thermoplasmata archaeon]|nr:hypothetical protein [Thermoplasmata archaeon]